VVVLHDVFGMTADLRDQADWLAREGFLAVAPDLFSGGKRLPCVIAAIRDLRSRRGATFADIDAVRTWLAQTGRCTAQIGVIGFCLGGGFAVLLASDRGYGAASVNYGIVPKDAGERLRGACPIVGSFGARDRPLRGAAQRLEAALASAGIAHDVREYPDAGHSFLNAHTVADVPALFLRLARMSGAAYHEPSAIDARRRIVSFFRTHLGPAA
jgi:carboxymethylenebutenolidase